MKNTAAKPIHFESLEQRLLLDALGLSVSDVTSSTVSLNWTSAAADEIRVYVSPEPDADKMMLLGTLSGTATSFTATNMAAYTEMFFTLEIDPTAGGTQSQMVHAKTEGGYAVPLVKLDNALREVHTYGPNILQVVLTDHDVYTDSHANDDGPTYQSGPWYVSRLDGTPIGITDVYRNSVPIDAPEYQIGYMATYSNSVIDADHSIYLVLDENIGSEDVLTISGPLGMGFIMPFSDQYTETTILQVNQVGYNPGATERWAYVQGWMGDGGGVSLDDFPTAARVLAEPTDVLQARTVVKDNLPITVRSTYDTDSLAPVDQIDLATVPAAEGVKYRVQLPGVGVSYVTAVSWEAAYKAYFAVMRGLYYNRFGQELSSEYGDWTRPADHTTFYIPNADEYPTDPTWNWEDKFPTTQALSNPTTSHGGYHDAGDFDQRPMHTIVPQVLLQSYELDPSKFTDGQLSTPESITSYDTLPDQLDEALWGVYGWMTLQDSATGGVHAGVESTRHPYGYYFASDEPGTDPATEMPYWAYPLDPQVTARASGLFAQASRLLRDLDGNGTGADDTLATDLASRAAAAYTWAANNGGDAHFLIYGASELYRLTGDTAYRTAFDSHWTTIGGMGGVVSGQLRQGDYAGPTYRATMSMITSYALTQGATSSIVNTILSTTTTRADGVYTTAQRTSHAYRSAYSSSVPTWGEATGAARQLDPIFAQLQLGTSGLSAQQIQNQYNAMSLTADWLFGCNPMGMSWVTGLGTKSPQDPLHLDAQTWDYYALESDDPLEIQPGIVVYGPVETIGDANGYGPSQSAFYPYVRDANYPIMRRYADSRVVVTTTEFTVWETTGPVAAMLSALVGEGMTVPASWEPGEADHRNPLPGGMTAFNDTPSAAAGADQNVYFPTSWVALGGQASDDGFGSSTLTTTWTKVSGPGTVAFGNVNSLSTTAFFSQAGVYVLRLTASDGTLSDSDELTVNVIPTTSVLANGGFETGDATGWTGIDGTLDAVIANDGLGGTGNYLLHVTSGDWQYPAFRTSGNGSQQTNTNYMLTVRFKWNASTSRSVVVNVKNSGGTLATQTVSTSTTEWQTILLGFNSGSTAFYVEFQHGGGSGAARDYYVDDLVVGALSAAPNQAPIANAGPDQRVHDSDHNGSQSVTLNGSGSADVDGSISSYVWKEGANQIATGATPTVTLSEGTHNLTLEVTDNNSVTSTDTVVIVVSHNLAPTANAGADQFVEDTDDNGSQSVTLNSAGSSDSDGTISSYVWRENETTIATGANPTVTLSAGIHTIQLVVTDNDGDTATDTLVVRVAANEAPVVNAGFDAKMLMPHSVSLDGTAIDDGFPSDTLTTTWSKVSGPGTVTFGNATAVDTTASFSTAGTYVLRLTASDGASQATDDVTIIVRPAGVELADDANTIALYHLNGNGNDSSGNGYNLTVGGDAAFSTDNLGWMSTPAGQVLRTLALDDELTVTIPDSVFMPGSTASARSIEAMFYAQEYKAWSFTSKTVIGLYQDYDSMLSVYDGMWNDPYNPSVRAGTGVPVSAATWKNAVSTNEWHRLLITLETNGTVSAYIDGSLIGSGTSSINYSRTGNWTLTLGNLKGYIDEVRISDTVRASGGNAPPSVNAGSDGAITLPDNDVNLDGTVTDDGLPTPATLTYTWSKQSGPGTVAFGNASAVDTTATFSTSGTYVLRLTSSDSQYSAYDEVTITVNAASNTAPSVNAGSDDSITLPATASLDGTVTDDGLPNPPASLTYTWSMQSGPGTVTFGNASAVDTTASFSAAGTYVLRLTSSDSSLQSYDDITITVNAAQGGASYATSFDTDVSADWTRSNMTVDTTNGWMITTSGWGTVGYAYLAGDNAFNEADVEVTGTFGVMGGNGNMYAEIAARTTGTGTDGIRLVVVGNYSNAAVYLYDGDTLLDSFTGTTGIRSQYAPLAFTLTCDGTSITAQIVQTAGSSGGQSWNDVTVNLDGTASTYTGDGNVRFRGCSYTSQPRLYDISAESLTPANTAPVAVTDSYNTNEDTQLVVSAPGVLSNDTDSESDPLTAIKVTDPSHGSLTLNSNGSFTYTPTANWNGQDSFTYKANDGTVDGNTVTVTLTVNAVNDAPVAVADSSYSTNEDTQLVVSAPGVLSNDTDVENSTLTAIKVTDPSHGSVTLNSNGSFTYTPTANWNGSDSFTYKANDGTVDSNTVTVSITVNAVNDPPSVNAGSDDSIILSATASLDGTVTDVDSSPTVTWSKISGDGTVTFGNANAVDTTASFSAAGTYVLRLTANDGGTPVYDEMTITVVDPVLYSTSFNTDVSADWARSNMTVDTTNGWMITTSGWGTVGYGYLTGSEAVSETDVEVTGTFGVMGGNGNMYAEIAARTTGTGTDGIRLVVVGAWNNASVYLYDGDTLLDSYTGTTGIRSQYAPLAFTLTCDGTAITAQIVQTAGSGGGQSWNDVTVNLDGTASTYTGDGNVRFRGRSYTSQPRLYDIDVELL